MLDYLRVDFVPEQDETKIKRALYHRAMVGMPLTIFEGPMVWTPYALDPSQLVRVVSNNVSLLITIASVFQKSIFHWLNVQI